MFKGTPNNNERAEDINKGISHEFAGKITSIAEEVEGLSEKNRKEKEARTAEMILKIKEVLDLLELSPDEALDKKQFVADRAMVSEEQAEKILMALAAEERMKPEAKVIPMPKREEREPEVPEEGEEKAA